MPNRAKLNKSRVDQIRRDHPPGKMARYWDSDLRDFLLRVTKTGRATYCVWIDKKDFRIGDADILTPEQAREKAKEHLARTDIKGVSPKQHREQKEAEEAANQASTFAALVDAFLEAPEKKNKLRPKTLSQYRETLDRHVIPALGKRPISEITKAEVHDLLGRIQVRAANGRKQSPNGSLPGARMANLCQAIMRTIFNWAIDRDLLETNPAISRRKLYDAEPEKRPLMSDEAARLAWSLMEAEKAKYEGRGKATAIAMQLCFATLVRPQEMTLARRQDIDLKKGVWNIPRAFTKTKEVYAVQLSPLACRLFKEAIALTNRDWVFAKQEVGEPINRHDLSQRWGRMRDRHVKAAKAKGGGSPLEGIRLYDARSLGRTSIEWRLRFPLQIAELCIHHKPAKSIATRYDVGDHKAVARAAMMKWGELLEQIVFGEGPPSETALSAA